ncbi:aminoacyl-tRNA hydrolase [Salipaludibacillus agaradhaerens]|uniref:aminoacyl-tRNA hydrolase n=1 Tax=Salipaludibacillus agaradhaerens TaxID=76935 RepID=UPI0021516A1E|nr:aminoacyl-tRNA hydrolase [Salipaludibacillus agaradhaerens]MCR6104755.1 aminoacyl-tRNA hydrolase [Salipaludibacillus agaradhaerens]MCR6116803.1 aminoacyl-tRNA hydrolase [Salipaludibacillus agaradhaerens]UJW59593.1 aminoacyl-tRNA hydrolase [Bacillus sp. A116_S68]
MKLVVGLGNPGKKYERTRHNVGFEVIDKCQQLVNVELNQAKFKGAYGVTRIGTEKIYLLKPLTYMNLSGESVGPLMNYFKMTSEDLLVIYDDLDLPPGTIRLRQKGGHGGHNGMKSIIQHIGTDQFKRIRVGVGRPDPGESVPDYVLGNFPPQEREDIDDAVERAAQAVQKWTEIDFLKVMNDYNQS